MKPILFTVLILLHCKLSIGQVLIALVFGEKLQSEKLEFGLTVSPTFSSITEVDGDPKFGMGLGLYFNVKMNQNFFFHLEAIPKVALGAEGIPPYPTGDADVDKLFADGSVTRKVKAVGLPLLCRFRLKKTWFADIGPQVDMILNGKDTFVNTVDDNELTYTIKQYAEYTRFDVGIAGGLEYKLRRDKGMGFGLRYFYGLTDMMKLQSGHQSNQALLINVSIPVGAGKLPKEAQ